MRRGSSLHLLEEDIPSRMAAAMRRHRSVADSWSAVADPESDFAGLGSVGIDSGVAAADLDKAKLLADSGVGMAADGREVDAGGIAHVPLFERN